MSRWRVPTSDTSGTITATSAERTPLIPAEPIVNVPLIAERTTKSVVPSPRCSATSDSVMIVVAPPPVPDCSNEKLPLSVWPRIDSCTFVPDTRRYGPGLRSIETVESPIVTDSVT